MEWTTQKPTEPGGYWIRGFDLGDESRPALVEVDYDGDDLVCNLHEKNTDSDKGKWYAVADLEEDFEWVDPLTHNVKRNLTMKAGSR